jgi:hypothetical protein
LEITSRSSHMLLINNLFYDWSGRGSRSAVSN